MKLNWQTIGQPREWPKPCSCEFICEGMPMYKTECPVHKDLPIEDCCGDASNPGNCACKEYRPKRRTPTISIEDIGDPSFATRWAKCVCGHPAQWHG